MLSPVIFLPTIKEALDKSISETFLLVISAYNLCFLVLLYSVLQKKSCAYFCGVQSPLHIPVILGTAERVILNPSDDTVSIRLNLSTVSPGVYLNIVPVLTPTKL